MAERKEELAETGERSQERAQIEQPKQGTALSGQF